MADNITLNGTTVGGGPVLSTRDVGSAVHVQRVKATHGDGATCTDVSATAPMPVSALPRTSGGCSVHSVVATATDNAAVLKASAGQVYGWAMTNESDAWVYLKVYDKATTPSGGDTPKLRLGIPPGGGQVKPATVGIAFANGISVRIVEGIADGSSTQPEASKVAVNLEYA